VRTFRLASQRGKGKHRHAEKGEAMSEPETKPAETKPADDDAGEYPEDDVPERGAIWTGEWWER